MNHTERPAPLFVTADETAYYLSVSRSSVFNMLKSGELKSVVIAGRRLVPFAELKALAEAQPTPEDIAAAEKRTRKAAAAVAVRRKRATAANQNNAKPAGQAA